MTHGTFATSWHGSCCLITRMDAVSRFLLCRSIRFDGADVAHLLRDRARLAWDRLERRFGDRRRLLLSHLGGLPSPAQY